MGTHCLATQEATVTMKFLAVLSTALACASAQFGYAGYPYAAAHAAPIAAVHSIPVAAAPLAAPEVTSSQFRAEDEAGNTAYGYQNINNAAQQRGNAYGGVEGSYSLLIKLDTIQSPILLMTLATESLVGPRGQLKLLMLAQLFQQLLLDMLLELLHPDKPS